MSLFATDYTWTGAGDDHGWRTPANWGRTDSNYPKSGDRAIFPAGCSAEVEIGAAENYEAVAFLRVLEGANVRFYAADPSAETRLDLKSSWELNNKNIAVTFDHIRVDGGKKLELGSGATLAAVNGSDLRLGDFVAKNAAAVSLLSGSVLSCKYLDGRSSANTAYTLDNATLTASETFDFQNTGSLTLTNGARMSVNAFLVTGDTVLTLDDSTFVVNSHFFCGTATPGGGRIVFKGAHPLFSLTNGSAEFKTQNNNAGYTGHFDFDFIVPEGGFAEAPVHHIGQQAFRNVGNNPTDYIRFNVIPSSPALSTGTQTVCPLFFSIQNGIVRSKLSNGNTATATFRFTDLSGATETTDDWGAKALYATIGSGAAAPAPSTAGSLSPLRTTSVNRHRITATGAVGAIATNGDTTHIELWAGESSNAATMSHVATLAPETAPARFTAEFAAPENIGEKKYYFQWRLFDIGEGGVTNRTEATAIFDATTKDTTIYTWQDVNGDWDGDWTDPAHWASDYASGYGYPKTGNATAVFPAGQPVVVTISENTTVGTIDLTANKGLDNAATAEGVEVTFKGAAETGTNRVLTVSSHFNVQSALGTVTLDNAAIKAKGNSIEAVSGKTIRLVNGSDFYCDGNFTLRFGSVLEVSEHSVANVNEFQLSSSGTRLVIDDSRFISRSHFYYGRDGSGAKVVFKGANPVYYWMNNNAACFPYSWNSAEIVFNVPVGGYLEPVFQCSSNMNNDLFGKNNKSGTLLTLSIDPESPFYSDVATADILLAAWPTAKSIDRTLLGYGDIANGGTFLFGTGIATGDYGFTPAESFSGTAHSLGVRLVSPAHDGRLEIASDAAVEFDGYSPVLGSGTAAAGDSVTATAPASYTADGVRYTCTGWTLSEFVAGTANTVAGTPVEGTGNSATFTMPAGGAKVEWHYATAYTVSATAVNDAGGAVAKSADYTTATSPVTLTASTATEGMEFQYWYGDVPYESRYANPLVISGDAAKNITAFFGATAANGATRTLSYNGNVGKEWFDVSAWADGVIPGTNDTAVLVNTSTYNLHQEKNKGRVIAPSFVAVKNLVVSNAVLLVGARHACCDGNISSGSNPAVYWGPDQNGNYCYKLSVSYDENRTEPVGLDVFGDVVLDSSNRSYANGNSGGAVFVGGTTARCNTRVNVSGDLDVVNGAFEVVAGYPLDFVPDPGTAVDRGFMEFDHPEEFFRGGNFLKVGGTTYIRTPTATKVYNFLQVANDFRTGAALWLDLNEVEIGEGAYISSFFGGYSSFDAQGAPSGSRSYSFCPGGHQTGDTYDGGSHGGLGGKGNGSGVGYDNPTETTTVYDYELTPMYPGSRNGGDGNDRGAGSIRLDCATLNLDGGLIATGRSGGKGGSAGGSIWVVCDTFNAGDDCKVFADGGDKNCGGGGGRIAICEGLTPEQVDSLFATHEAPQDVTVTDLADKLGPRMTVAGGTGTVGKYSKGYPGTAVYLVNTAGKKTLTVAGNPANLGSPAPAYGPQVLDEGENIEFFAPDNAFVTDDNRSRRVAVGYTITDTETGAVIADETATSGVITLTGDWTLTWDLTLLQHSLDISAATPGGTITTNAIGAAGEAWQDDGSALSVTAVPASGYRFAGWFGEIAEAVQYDATFSTNVTGALRVRAVFVSDDVDTATWTGAGDGTNFLDAANWSTGKVPGPKSAVVVGGDASVTGAVGLVFNVKSLAVSAGASLAILPEGAYATTSWDPRLYPESVSIYDWHDCGIAASGDITVAGTLVAGRRDSAADAKVVAGGAFTIAEGASVTVNGGYRLDLTASGAKETPASWRIPSALASAGVAMTVNGSLAIYGERLSGSPCKVAAGTLVVGATGSLHSNSGGWGRSSIGGTHVYYSYNDMGGSYNGGAYGGFGGGYNGNPALVTDYGNKNTYGDALRPYLPGSQGGNWDGALGGGALRIDVAGRVSNNGTISANGKDVGGSSGGGSGGGIWITCHKFVNGAEGSLLARGGNNTNNGGAGGGGRILVCENLTAEQVDALYATGVAPRKVTATEVTDANAAEVFAGTVSAAGGTNVKYSASNSYWSGTAGSIWRLAGKATKFVIVVR